MLQFCRGEIGQLEGEKQELLKELRLAESRSNQVMDEDHTDTLVTLADAKGMDSYKKTSCPLRPVLIHRWFLTL